MLDSSSFVKLSCVVMCVSFGVKWVMCGYGMVVSYVCRLVLMLVGMFFSRFWNR